ncbi:MAG: hypothetical protein LBH18_06890 [Spirochaetaceae bacterium]|jgi:hypothetical protein|nr:hypothetical protein [Spirochaetaceae bacterium]
MLMTLKNTKKISFRRLAVSTAAAFITLYLAVYFLSGPRLGPHYDFLMEARPRVLNYFSPSQQLIAPEILLIETGGDDHSGGNLIAASTVFDLMMILSEMNAGALLIETPVLGVSSGHALSETELVYRFDEEFNIIESNVKNLFDGIRLGSIAPADAARYVSDVIKLTEYGKNRLLSAVAAEDEEQAARLENAATVFDAAYLPGDLLMGVIQPENDASHMLSRLYFPLYSRPPPDEDGKVRRIAPALTAVNGVEYEYVVYGALKKLFPPSETRLTDDSFTLSFEASSPDERRFILDSGAALLFGVPEGGGEAFRKIDISVFLDYAEAGKMLYRLLAEAPALAEYASISVENYPPFLYEQTQIARETLLENPTPAARERWLSLCAAYFNSLESFFDENDGAKSKIISSFRELGEQENLDAAGKLRLDTLRNEQLEMIYTAGDLYNDVSVLRSRLKNELNEAFCILGPVSRDTELSTMFANSVMTGYYTVPANIKQILFSSLLVILFLLGVMNAMGSLLSFCTCVFATALIAAAFSYSFIISGLWIDPLIPGGAAAAGALASSLFALFTKKQSETRLRCACAAITPEAYLKKIIQNEAILEKEISAKAAIVTIIRPDAAIIENGPNAQKAAAFMNKFHDETCSALIKTGAVIITCDREIISAAFGSPLERFATQKTRKAAPYTEQSEASYVNRAVTAVKELFKSFARELYAGIDYGECVFAYTPLTGYTATGSAVFRSRVLSVTARRGGTLALISKTAGEKVSATLFRGNAQLYTDEGETAAPVSTGAADESGSVNGLYYQLILPKK